jgi:tetratricopeptide (TPR) repeat protein
LRFLRTLDAPAYLVRQFCGSTSYYNLRLIRRDLEARYVGSTHEYLAVSPAARRLDTIWFRDHADGANRSEKYRRDLVLLTRALEANPEDPRATFYLAQTLREMGRYAEAGELYRKRIAQGGWIEEVWYSTYMLALCHRGAGEVTIMPTSELCRVSWPVRFVWCASCFRISA